MNATNSKPDIFLFVLISLFSVQIIAQNTYYVSPFGNDLNDESEDIPWLRIQEAINYSSGVYYYQLIVGNFIKRK